MSVISGNANLKWSFGRTIVTLDNDSSGTYGNALSHALAGAAQIANIIAKLRNFFILD